METGESCGLVHALGVIGSKWRPAILLALQAGPLRYGALRRGVLGISEKVLVDDLRVLEAAGVVSRQAADGSALRVDYQLTSSGVELCQAVSGLAGWGRRYGDAAVEAICRQTGPADAGENALQSSLRAANAEIDGTPAEGEVARSLSQPKQPR